MSAFEKMVKDYQKKYSYKPEEIKEDTKTKVLRSLLGTYNLKEGWFSKKTRVARVKHIRISEEIEKNGKVYEDGVNNALYLCMNTPDIHEALIEISKETGIKFEFHSYTEVYYLVKHLKEEVEYSVNPNADQTKDYIALTQVKKKE